MVKENKRECKYILVYIVTWDTYSTNIILYNEVRTNPVKQWKWQCQRWYSSKLHLIVSLSRDRSSIYPFESWREYCTHSAVNPSIFSFEILQVTLTTSLAVKPSQTETISRVLITEDLGQKGSGRTPETRCATLWVKKPLAHSDWLVLGGSGWSRWTRHSLFPKAVQSEGLQRLYLYYNVF